LELKGTHQLLLYADDANMLCENINAIKKNTEALSEVDRKVSLEVNTEKTKYMIIHRHQSAGQNYNLHKFFESVAKLKCFGTTVTNQKCIYEENKIRLKSKNASCHSVQSAPLLSKNLKIKIQKPAPYLMFFMGVKLGLSY
jgi:hypothetical protein